MTILPPNAKTFSSRDFNQRTNEAKKAANTGPVFITDRGEASHVLLSIDQYQKLTSKPRSLAEALEQKGAPDFEFDPPRMGTVSRDIDWL